MGVVLARALFSITAILGDPTNTTATTAPTCPERHAVEQELDRLGAAPALAQKGTPDITVDDSGMRIVLRGRDGKVLGMREIAAPAACQERAVVAAVVIAAWLGEWSASEPRATAPAPPSATPVLMRAPAPPPAPTVAPRARPRIDLAAFGSVVHDGDVGTWAAGGELAFGLGDRFSVTAQGHTTGERTQALGPGQAAYQSLGLGAGVSWRRPLGHTLLLDAGAGPEVLRTALRGEKLSTPRDATAWSLAIDARIRLGLRLGPVVPFVYGGAAYALARAKLTLDDRPDTLTLSRWNVAAGLGLLFSLPGPAG
jgi:opacity protein-like surface antigen